MEKFVGYIPRTTQYCVHFLLFPLSFPARGPAISIQGHFRREIKTLSSGFRFPDKNIFLGTDYFWPRQTLPAAVAP
jgi:hypothetical protein